jgi:hypothetical protein
VSFAPCPHHTAPSGTLAISECVLGTSTCHLFGRSYARATPLHLWGIRAPTTGLALYGNVLPAILQCLPCVSHACVADGVRRLAHAQPYTSDPHRARAPGRELPASAPAHTRTSRDPHGPAPAAELRGTRMVDPPGCQPPQCPCQHPTLSATHARHSGGMSRCPSLLRSACDGAEGQRAWAVACTYGRNPRVPTGEAPVYLWEKCRVPMGEISCTYGRRNMR